MEAVKERVEEGQGPSPTMEVSLEADTSGKGANDQLEALNINVTESFNIVADVTLESSIFVDNDQGANVDIAAASSSQISSAVPSLPSFTKPIKEQLGDASSSSFRPEEWELDLNEVYVKPGNHEFYCPRCDACITKVIVRGSQEKTAPKNAQDRCTQQLICSSCFGFLIPLGEWLSSCCSRYGIVGTDRSAEYSGHGWSSTGAPVSITPPYQGGYASTSVVSLVAGKPTTGLPSVTTAVEAGGENLLGVATGGVEKIITGSSAVAVQQENILAYHNSDIDPLSSAHKPGVYAKTMGVASSVIGIGEAIYAGEAPKPSELGADGSLQDIMVHRGGSIPAMLKGRSKELVTGSTEATADSGSRGVDKWEILKSIVYGGLAESITSLSVVSSAASADTATLNIIALALANLVGGLFVLGQNLWELRKDQPGEASNHTNPRADRYQELLGEKKHFAVHVMIAVLSFLFFGLIPPVVYGFTFIKSNNRDYKLAAVAAASLVCVLILAIGKALILKPEKFRNYVIIAMQYVAIAIMASGVSFLAGDLFEKLLEKLGWFSSSIAAMEPIVQVGSRWPAWSSH